MRIAVLALQGAFAEHEQMLRTLGVEPFEVRCRADWDQPKDGLIIPGGESTTMRKLLCELQLIDPVRSDILGGLPVFGTCAGLIMLGSSQMGTMHIDVRRNAFGRQLGSFFVETPFEGVGSVPMTFIRAPYIEQAGEGVEVLATVDGHIVAAREGWQLATAFHPELNTDTRIHAYFVEMCRQRREQA